MARRLRKRSKNNSKTWLVATDRSVHPGRTKIISAGSRSRKSLVLIAALFTTLFAGALLASTAQAEEQRQVTVCKRQWYCAWLCKKCKTETRWCYDFSSIHTSCRVFVETLHGCEQGREYKWTAGCFGWFTACLGGRTRCFANRLDDRGRCDKSLCTAPIANLDLSRDAADDVAAAVTLAETCDLDDDACAVARCPAVVERREGDELVPAAVTLSGLERSELSSSP